MKTHQLSQYELKKIVYSRLLVFIPIIMALFFVPAGTLAYWEAWVYLIILLVPMFWTLSYFLRHDPELLQRRMRMREKEAQQKIIVRFANVYFLLVFLLPGFDKRFAWSTVPIIVILVGDIGVLLGYSLFILVLRANSYASRTIEVEQGQTVISSGPYAIVRHPMYLAVSLMYIATPLALGSYWATLPAMLIIPILVARILNEEDVLLRELAGYRSYMSKTRYRLLPGVW